MEKQKILNAEQSALVVELTETYNIKPEEIMFFSDDPNPFLSYEAMSKLANRLANLPDIDIEPIPSVSPDSFSMKCVLTREDGYTRRGVGVVNINETIDGIKMSDTQISALASSRALRNALRNADIDLLQLHNESKSGVATAPKPQASNRAALLFQAHQLGKDAFLIIGEEKRPWYNLLKVRYGVSTSSELSEDHQLPDFVAYLKTLVSQKQAAA